MFDVPGLQFLGFLNHPFFFVFQLTFFVVGQVHGYIHVSVEIAVDQSIDCSMNRLVRLKLVSQQLFQLSLIANVWQLKGSCLHQETQVAGQLALDDVRLHFRDSSSFGQHIFDASQSEPLLMSGHVAVAGIVHVLVHHAARRHPVLAVFGWFGRTHGMLEWIKKRVCGMKCSDQMQQEKSCPKQLGRVTVFLRTGSVSRVIGFWV